jgi:hypothetical protein
VWTKEEDMRIIKMKEVEKKSWKDIAKCSTGRTPLACQVRYTSHLKKGEKRAYVVWTNDDDERIIQMFEVEKMSWKDIAKCFNGRTPVACQVRYSTHLKKREMGAVALACANDDDSRNIEVGERRESLPAAPTSRKGVVWV